jgi:hypothetical protein
MRATSSRGEWKSSMNNKNLRERKINLARKIMKKNPTPSTRISLYYFIFFLLEERERESERERRRVESLFSKPTTLFCQQQSRGEFIIRDSFLWANFGDAL